METEIVTLISNMGFPIVAFLMMYKMCNETLTKVTTALNELKEVVIKLESKIGDDDNNA